MTKKISIHSLRVEGDIGKTLLFCRFRNFNPLPPCGGRLLLSASVQKQHYFNPLPPCGGRPHVKIVGNPILHFNPLPPCGGRRQCDSICLGGRDFNPLPPCGGRRRATGISEHAIGISIHSLRVEGDATSLTRLPIRRRFQSTPSVWRETHKN